MRARTPSTKRRQVTCEDCYFRQEGLCAIPGNSVCPTFRAARGNALAPPVQPRLIPRGLPVAVAERVA